MSSRYKTVISLSFKLALFIPLIFSTVNCGKQFFDHDILEQYYRQNDLSEYFYREIGACSTNDLSFLVLSSAGALDISNVEDIRSINLLLYFFSDGTYALEYAEYNNEELVTKKQVESNWSLLGDTLIFEDLGETKISKLNAKGILPLTMDDSLDKRLAGKTYRFRQFLLKEGFYSETSKSSECEKEEVNSQ